MRARLLLLSLVAALTLLGLGASDVSAARLSTTIFTDTTDYAPGDSVAISGSGYWPGETVTVSITNVFNPGVGEVNTPWSVVADGFGNFETFWIVPSDGVDQTFQVSATGQSSGIVATSTFTDSNTKLEFTIDLPDSVCTGSELDVCAYLAQNCGGGNWAALANREILFFINAGSCGNNVQQNADDSVLTDANGIACATLTLPSTPGTYSIRIKFRGEDKPASWQPPNSACDPTQRTQLSAANECQEIVVSPNVGSTPDVTLGADFTKVLCAPTQICVPVLITDPDCDLDTVTSNLGNYAGTVGNYDQVSRLNQLGGAVTQIGGGMPGKILYVASDFVPSVNALSGVSVTLPNFIFASSVTNYGSFPSGIGPAQSADQLKGAPTDLTFTLPGAGGPDGGSGDGSVDFATGNHVTLGFASLVTTCNGSDVDLIVFSNSDGGGNAEILLFNGSTPVHSVINAIPGGSSGSGTGGVTFDFPDGLVFNRVKIRCTSGNIEVDAVAARTVASSSTSDICFQADTTGVYRVIVTATDDCGHVGADTQFVTVTLNQPPVANAGADFSRFLCLSQQICFPVSFSDPNGNLQTTSLVAGPGTLSGSQICFTPTMAGMNTFIIQATDSCGATDRDTVVVTVSFNAPPIATNPPSQTVFQCDPAQLCYQFLATDANGGALTWSKLAGVGAITSGGQFCFTPTTSGTYAATVVVTDSCGAKDTTSISYLVTINSNPVAVNPASPQNLFQCVAAQVCYQFSASDVNGGTLTWTKLTGSGTVTSGGLWCFTPVGAGAYSATVVVTDSCGDADSTSLTYNVTLNGPPTIALGNDTTISLCSSQQLCFPYTVSDPQGLGKLVETLVSGYGSIDTMTNQVCFTPTMGGSYQFIVSVTDSCGLFDRDTLNVSVVFNQGPQITCPSGPINVSLCAAGPVCQSLPITPGSATVTTTLGTWSAGQLCFNAAASGTYNAQVVATTPCGADTCDIAFNVTIGQAAQLNCPGPQNFFICKDTTLCVPVGVMGAGATVSVSPIGNYASGNVCFPADTAGQYVLTVIASTPCGADTCQVAANVTRNAAPVAVNPPSSADTFLCVSQQVCFQFTASDANGGSLVWSRLSGDGAVSAAGLWCFTASADAAYSVVAAVTDPCGAADTVSMTFNVQINDAPVLSLGPDASQFQCAPAQICLPLTASDPNNNLSGISLVSGTGTVTLAPAQLCFTPTTAGIYTFIAELTDSCGATDRDTVNVTVTLNSPPTISAGPDQTVFQCSLAQICTSITTADPDNNITSVQLINGPGTLVGNQHCFTPTGTYNYEFVFKVTDACGATAVDTMAVYYTLNTPPVANAGADQTLFQCTPTQVCWPAGCSDVNGNLTMCELLAGPGSLGGGQICFTPSASGAYQFIVRATDACGAIDLDTALITVTINSAPVCAVPNDTTIALCTPAQVCLPVSGTDIDNNLTSCQIISGPGTLSGGQWCYTPTSSQVVTVTVRCTDACGAYCESTFTVEFFVNQPPSIAFGPTSPLFLCASQPVCLPFTVSDPDIGQSRTVTLVSGPGSLDLPNSQVCFTPASSGNYTFVVQVTDSCGAMASDTASIAVTLNAAPVANAGPDQTVNLCAPGQICWPASCSDINANLVACDLTGPGTYSGGQICFTPAVSGVYTFTLTATDACGAVTSDDVTITVNINNPPSVDLGPDQNYSLCAPQQICLGYTVADPDGLAGLTEVMLSGFGSIDTMANQICFTPTTAGNYQFIVKVTDPCGAFDQDTVVVAVTFNAQVVISCPTGPIAVSLCAPDQVCQSLPITPGSATVTTTFGTWSAGQLCFSADTTGTYAIRVIATDVCGADTCDLSFVVTIGQAAQISCPGPQQRFICTTENICVPVGVMGSGATVSVTPIGSYAAGDVCFMADTAGLYQIRVIASTACGADTCDLAVTVTRNAAPVAVNPATPIDTFVCATGGQVCYQFGASDANSGPLVWSKLSGAGTVSASGLWCFTLSSAGSFAVTAVVTDSCGAADTTSLTYNVNVNGPPVISLGPDINRFICADSTICVPYTLIDAQDSVFTVSIVSGPGTVDQLNKRICFNPGGAGVFTIIAQAADPCGANDRDTVVVTITLNQPPVVNAGPDQSLFRCDATPICWPASVTDPNLNLDSAKIISGPGTFSGSQICFTPASDGVYTIVLEGKDLCGVRVKDTVVITVNLNAPPVCNIPNDTTYFQCVPTQVTRPVSATDPDGNFDHCEIVSGPGSIVGGNWVYTPSVDENRKVKIMCVDACGASCVDSFNVIFNLNAPPVAHAGNDTTVRICDPIQICKTVFGTDEDNNLATVTLESGPGTLAGGQLCFTPSQPVGSTQTYQFVIKATDACGLMDLDTVKVTVIRNSAPAIDGPPSFVAYMETMGELCFDLEISDVDGNLQNWNVSPIGTYDEINNEVCFQADTTGHYCLTITASDACGLVTTYNVCIDVVIDQCIHVQIEQLANVVQGQYVEVDIFLTGTGKPLGGFSFLIAYDQSAMSASGATPGALFTDCNWEYFTYRFGANGNCGTGCPSGLISITGVAETNNGAYHPTCYLDGQVGTLARLQFLVTNDRTFECQTAPISFFWTSCTDNTMSSPRGDTLWVDRHVYSWTLGEITNHAYGFPGYYGAPDDCLIGGGPDKPKPLRCIDFTSGAIHIVCADSIDARGDVNLNNIAYEIADAVMFTRYFLIGLPAFQPVPNPDGAIAATDVNADGAPLTVADLVYLIRVIVGDALPIPKVSPDGPELTAEFAVVNGVLTLERADGEVAGLHLVLEGEVTPALDPSVSNMELKAYFDGVNTRVILYATAPKAWLHHGPVMSLGKNAAVTAIEAGSYDGRVMQAHLGGRPESYALSQNFPNPFNPVTTIEFALPVQSEWRLTVFNVLGQEVVSWNDVSEAGYLKIEWNATSYASGVYFYRLQAGSFTQTRKMVLLK